MGGLGSVSFAPLVLDGRWMPGLTVVTDHPALACLASQYAGWKIDRDGYFAMASGPGRALIRAEELYDDLDVDERASTAVLCLETGDEPPDALAAYVAERAGVAPADLTLLFAPTASLAGGVQIAARIVETALHKLHELEFDVRRVVSGFGTCPLPPVARTDPEAIGRTNDAILYGGQVELTVDAPDDELEALVERLPSSASQDHGEPFGKILEEADWDFYAIDPLLFSPAEVRLVERRERTVLPRRERAARRPRAVLPGMIVETVTTTINPDGTVNCAAMGVEWGDDEIVILPYRSTRTLRNLQARGAAVVNLTDDILLFTQAALEDPHPPTRPAAVVDGAVLADACSWREVDGRRDRRDRTAGTRDDARRRPRQRARVRRLQPGVPRGPRGVDPRLARPPAAGGRDPRRAGAPGRRGGQDGRPARAGGDGLRPGARAHRDRRPMTTVRVEAPARLHMGMLDASGDGPRRFGGLGVAVSRPAVVVEASASDELTVEGPDAERALAVAQRCRDALGHAAGARVRVLEAIPAHAGLGSGTKLALAVTAALVRAGGAVARSGGDGAHGRARRPLGGGPVDVRPRRVRRRGWRAPRARTARAVADAPRDAGRVALRARDPRGGAGTLGRRRGGGVRGPAPRSRSVGGDRPGRADRPAAGARRARPRSSSARR